MTVSQPSVASGARQASKRGSAPSWMATSRSLRRKVTGPTACGRFAPFTQPTAAMGKELAVRKASSARWRSASVRCASVQAIPRILRQGEHAVPSDAVEDVAERRRHERAVLHREDVGRRRLGEVPGAIDEQHLVRPRGDGATPRQHGPGVGRRHLGERRERLGLGLTRVGKDVDSDRLWLRLLREVPRRIGGDGHGCGRVARQ